MNIVSHNTMSYLKPVHWYDKIFTRWSKCQTITLHKQYLYGIRWYDIRIKKVKGKWVVVHNSVVYGNSDWLRYVLIYLNQTEDKCHMRLMYDDRKKKNEEDSKKCAEDFKNLLSDIRAKYPNIDIYESITYWNWTYIDKNNSYCDVEKHASVSLPFWKYLLYGTKKYAEKYNTINKSIYSKENNCLLYIDYVNLG